MKTHKKTDNPKQLAHAFENALIHWRAPEFHRHEKSLMWFIIAGLVAAALVIYGLMTDGWTFSIAVIVFAGAYYVMHLKPPQTVDVKISKIGLKIGRHLYLYSHLKCFWIVYNPPHVKRLYVRLASKFQPDIFVSLEDVDPAEVRHTLKVHMTELEGQHEPFSDTLVRLFRL